MHLRKGDDEWDSESEPSQPAPIQQSLVMPPRRRATLPATPDDIASLSLAQINERLERNERVLNTFPFSPAPKMASSPTSDPMRDRLLAIRAALLARKQDLEVAANDQLLAGISIDSPAESSAQAQRRTSENRYLGNAKSARSRAMEIIEAGDRRLAPNSLQLPLSETLALGRRDFDDATARELAALSLKSRPKPRRHRPARPDPQTFDPSDEIARAQAIARMQAFMSFKGDPEDDQWDVDLAGEGEYDGDGDRFALEAQGREPHRYERGTGEEVDELGEDDEEWAEGNDDYLDRVR